MSDSIIMHCDGGSLGNPGRCYGSYCVQFPSGLEIKASRVNFAEGTNNQAEYWALLAGLRAIVSLGIREGEQVHISSDSTLVVNQLLGRWKCHKPHIRELRDEALGLLGNFSSWFAEWNNREVSVAKFGH